MRQDLVYKYPVVESELKDHYEDFIGYYDGFFGSKYCREVIEMFDFAKAHSPLVKHRKSHSVEDDYLFKSSFIDATDPQLRIANQDLSEYFKDIAEFLVGKYFEKYPVLNALEGFAIFDIKYQKTAPGEGFHQWHYENIGRQINDRRLAVQVYLNDIEEGGETEFLYYNKRVKPKQGLCLIYPAAFTHTHRGNTPIGQDKYLLTTWVEGSGKP